MTAGKARDGSASCITSGMRIRVAAAMVAMAVAAVAQTPDHTLVPSPTTVAWGYYSARAKPVLTVKPGETVRIQTASSCPAPERLEAAGVKPQDIPQFVRDVYAKVTDKGPGGHILTGPIAIEEAEPGDVLEVQVLKIDIDTPFA